VTPERHVRVEVVAWLAAILPFVAANVAYLISASADLVPWCFPYLDGCTSVSRAARSGIANPIFRGIMLPFAVVMVLYWWLAAEWLRGFAPQRPRLRRAMLGFGVVAAVFLVLYATFLGVEGEFYQWMRRYGITVHFSSTVLAQFLLTSVLAGDARLPQWLRRSKLALCALMLALGLASIPLQHFALDRVAALNAVEWSYSLLMLAFFPLTGEAWRLTRFRFRLMIEA
jgi:hypothetical protein